MKTALFSIRNDLCAECALALHRFIGGMDGVKSIDVENNKIAVTFDEAEIEGEKLAKITKDSIERLGYSLEDE